MRGSLITKFLVTRLPHVKQPKTISYRTFSAPHFMPPHPGKDGGNSHNCYGCPERGIDAVQECVGNTADEIGGSDEYLKCDTPGYRCGCNRDGDDKTSQDANVLNGPEYPGYSSKGPLGCICHDGTVV